MLFATPRSSAPRHRRVRTSHQALVVATAVAAAATGTLQLQPAPAQAAATYGIWSAGTVPHRTADPDTARVTLGVKFSSRVAGRVTGVRFYKSTRNVGPHVGQLWGPHGRLLAKVRFARTTRSGWQTAHFSHPVRITPHRRYVASYTAPNGHYAGDTNALSFARPKVTRYLVAWQGVYAYGTRMPTRSWRASNYYVDVVFSATTKAKPAAVRMPVRTQGSTAPAGPAAPAAPTTTTTAAVPPPSAISTTGKPGASNTGVPAGTTLTPSGGMRITRANTVVDGKDITGSVSIEASNVTIRNSRIHGSPTDDYGVLVRSGSVTIVDSEISGFSNGIAGDSWTATRVNLHGLADDGVKLDDNVTLQDSWVHDMTPSAGAHADGGQMQSGSRNVVVRHNVINMASGRELGNAALFIAPDLGPSSPGPVTITGNWLNGGNYTLFCVDGNNGQYFVNNITITDNRFGPDSAYGPVKTNVPITRSGNVMDVTGSPVRF